MPSKVFTQELRVGMFVSDLDRPWIDTPFLIQGFLIEDEDQIRELQAHCEFVIVDRERSIGGEYEAAPGTAPAARPEAGPVPPGTPEAPASAAAEPAGEPPPLASKSRTADEGRVVRLETIVAQRPGAEEGADYPGLLGRVLGRWKGLWGKRQAEAGPGAAPGIAPEPTETAEEFEARAALLPAGIEVQTYRNQVDVETEVPRAREVYNQISGALDKLVSDLRAGAPLEIAQIEEVVHDMVESVVRNPDALMWVARLREADITTYGHGLQVAVYLTAFGRHLGFPKPQLAVLGQVGLLLDIGKLRLPRELLEKHGRLTAEEFAAAKEHVRHGLAMLSQTPNFQPEVLEGIAQHHERMNGSGYPAGLAEEAIGIYGRMAGIADCFAALTRIRPYANAVSPYEALRSLTGWTNEYFHDALVQQFISSMGVFPVGSMIELSTGEVAIVVAHNKVRRLKPRVLVVTGPDKAPAKFPSLLDLLYEPQSGREEAVYIRRGLAEGAYGLDLRDFYLA